MNDTSSPPLMSDPLDNSGEVTLTIARPEMTPDYVTIAGLALSLLVIVIAILISQSNASFFDVPSLFIVVFGTIFVTSTSYTWDELSKAGKIFGQSLFKRQTKLSVMARQLMDMAVISRKKGFLAFSYLEREISKDKVLADALQIVTDGYSGEDVERVLSQDIDALVERHRRSASIARRGAEVAPAMGLIGTLVGLVQMLADLSNPDSIGPAMAVALLTTFYGALLGTVVLTPLAAKLERNSNDEAKIRTLILTAMSSMARQESPRRLEMLLNSELPPDERIKYFD